LRKIPQDRSGCIAYTVVLPAFARRGPYFCVPRLLEFYRYLEKIFLFLVALKSLVKSSLRFALISVRMVFILVISFFFIDARADPGKAVALLKSLAHPAGL